MAKIYPTQLNRPADKPYIILEISDREGETALRVPVVVLNLTAGVVTLEAIYPQSAMGWDNFAGLHGSLRLRFQRGEEPIDIGGKLAWTRLAGEGGRHLTLGLELAKPTLTARKILGDLMPHTAEDMKGLWDRWDQAYAGTKPSGGGADKKIYLLGMILLLGGVGLQLGNKSLQLFGWILWFLGSLAVAGKSLWSIWQKKFPR
jgi:hypothetical protein